MVARHHDYPKIIFEFRILSMVQLSIRRLSFHHDPFAADKDRALT